MGGKKIIIILYNQMTVQKLTTYSIAMQWSIIHNIIDTLFTPSKEKKY